jgi:hypothetical protein
MGLMSLAYVRIAAHSLRQAMGALETPSASSVQLDNDKKVVEEKVEVGNRKL